MTTTIILGFCYLVLTIFLMIVEWAVAFELLPNPIWHWKRGDLADRLTIISKALLIIIVESVTIACAVGIIMELIRLM